MLPAVSSLSAKGKMPADAPDAEPHEDPDPWKARGEALGQSVAARLWCGGLHVGAASPRRLLTWPFRYGDRQMPQPCSAPFEKLPAKALAIGIAPASGSLDVSDDRSVWTLL